MRAVIQRVKSASVSIDGSLQAAIGPGLLVLFAAGREDTACEDTACGTVDATETRRRTADFWRKIERMRIFADRAGKTNLSLGEVGGELLIVPQFTLYADMRRGNRPSFTAAAPPSEGLAAFESFTALAEAAFPGRVRCGVFGADMQVELINDGPFTVILDSKTLFAPRARP